MRINDQLLDQCLRNDERAQHTLYNECYSLMKGIAIRYVQQSEDAADVMNRGFLKVVNKLNTFDRGRSFEAWVRKIIVNTALDFLRKKKRRLEQEVSVDEQSLDQTNPSLCEQNLAELEFDAAELRQMINRLPDRTKLVFNLFAIDGYSHKEIAEQLGLSTGTSKWHVATARKSLQNMILKNRINIDHLI